jgi:hypothetical protein
MSDIEIFLQGAGIPKITLVKIPQDGKVSDVVEAAKAHGLHVPEGEQPLVLIEDTEEPLAHDLSLSEAGIRSRSRLHVHTCRRIKVTVNFKGESKSHPFSPSTTVQTVKRWADKQFGLEGVDATEHALQICNSSDRPSEDTHLGTLVHGQSCELCFDLVPKQRVEG